MASLRVAEGKEIGFLSTIRLSRLILAGISFTECGFLHVSSQIGPLDPLGKDPRGLLVCLFGVDYDFVSLPSRQEMSSRPLTYIVGFPTK